MNDWLEDVYLRSLWLDCQVLEIANVLARYSVPASEIDHPEAKFEDGEVEYDAYPDGGDLISIVSVRELSSITRIDETRIRYLIAKVLAVGLCGVRNFDSQGRSANEPPTQEIDVTPFNMLRHILSLDAGEPIPFVLKGSRNYYNLDEDRAWFAAWHHELMNVAPNYLGRMEFSVVVFGLEQAVRETVIGSTEWSYNNREHVLFCGEPEHLVYDEDFFIPMLTPNARMDVFDLIVALGFLEVVEGGVCFCRPSFVTVRER